MAERAVTGSDRWKIVGLGLIGNTSYQLFFITGIANLSGGKAGVREWEKDKVREFFTAIEQTPRGETLYVLASYTAMWTLRRELVQRGYLAPFFRQAASTGGMAR